MNHEQALALVQEALTEIVPDVDFAEIAPDADYRRPSNWTRSTSSTWWNGCPNRLTAASTRTTTRA